MYERSNKDHCDMIERAPWCDDEQVCSKAARYVNKDGDTVCCLECFRGLPADIQREYRLLRDAR